MRSVATAKFRHKGMGKSIPKGRLYQRGKGPYLTTFHLPLLNPLPLLKYSHPLPMPCPCRPPASARCTRSITELLVTTDSATAYRAPASLSSPVCHTGPPRWFATQALLVGLPHRLPPTPRHHSAPCPLSILCCQPSRSCLALLRALPRTSLSMSHRLIIVPQILRLNLQLSVALLLQSPPLPPLRSTIRIPSSELPP